jgi:pSer/pThr/pTyr-binding forkhead associated (FHA) protein
MRAKLKVMRGASAGKFVDIGKQKFLIGRADGCTLRLNHEAISRKHCLFVLHDDKVTLRDMGSRNGTYLNGERLKNEVQLATGDELRIGPLLFEVVVTDDAGKVQVPPGPDPEEHVVDGKASDSGLISDWLTEADEEDETKRSTAGPRQFVPADSNKIDLDTKSEVPSTEETKAFGFKLKKSKDKKKKPGKLPTQKKDLGDDSQEAAAETLRRLFNNRGN